MGYEIEWRSDEDVDNLRRIVSRWSKNIFVYRALEATDNSVVHFSAAAHGLVWVKDSVSKRYLKPNKVPPELADSLLQLAALRYNLPIRGQE